MSCPAVGDLGVSEDVRAEPSNVELLLKETVVIIIISREFGRGSVTNFYSLEIIQSDGSLELVYIRHSSHSQEYQNSEISNITNIIKKKKKTKFRSL